jgi:translocation and assembly module TamB
MRRVLLRFLAGLCLLLVVMIGAVFALIDAAFVRSWITDTVNAQLASPDGSGVMLSGFGPGLPGQINIEAVTLYDRDGVWLEVREIAVDWNPWALISSDVDVALIAVNQIAVLRAPLPGASGEEAPPSSGQVLPDPPGIGVRLGQLQIASVLIDETFTGQALAFDLAGSADLAQGGAGAVNLQVHQTLGGTGSLALDGAFDLGRDQIALRLDASEEPGGVLITLLGIEGVPAVAVMAKLDGAASDFAGQVILEAGEGLSVDLNLSGNLSDAATYVTVDGTIDVDSFLDTTTRPLVGEAIFLDLDIVMAGDLLTIRKAQIDLAVAQIATTGTVALDTETLKVTTAIENRDLAPVLAMAGGAEVSAWRSDVAVTGTIAQPMVNVEIALSDLAVEGITAGGLSATAQVTALDQGAGWTVDLIAGLDGISAGDPGLDGLLGDLPSLHVLLDADQTFDQVKLESATMLIAAGRLDAVGSLGLGEGRLELTSLTGRFDLEQLSGLTGLPMTGEVNLRAAARTSGWTQSVDAVISVSGKGVVADDPVGALLGASPEISARLTGDGERWNITELTLASPVWQALGEVELDLPQGTVSAALSGPITVEGAIAQALDPALGASGKLSISAAGTLDQPEMNLRLDLAQAHYGDLDLDGLSLRVSELTVADGIDTKVGVSLPHDNEQLALGASVSTDPAFTEITVSRVTLRGLMVDLGGDITVPLDGRPMEGRLAGGIADLGPLASLAGLVVTGAGLVDVTMRGGSGGRQDVSLGLAMADVAMDDMSVADLRVAVDALDVLNTPQISARMSADGVSAAGQVIHRMIASADGDLDDLFMNVQAKSDIWTLDTNFSGDFSQGVNATVSGLNGTVGEETFSLSREFTVSVAGEAVNLENFSLDFAGGNISLSASAAPKALAGTGAIANIPMAAIGAVHEALDLKGMLDGDFHLNADASGATAHLNLKAAGVGSRDELEGETADLDVNAQWDGRSVDGKVEITGIDGLTAHATVWWPLTHYPDEGTVLTAEDDPFKATVTIQGGLAKLWDRLPIGDQTLSGDLDIAIAASGTLNDPKIEGSATVKDARYENFTAGTLIEKLNLTTSIDADGSLSLQASGSDGDAGTLMINGHARIDKGDGLSLDTTLELTTFQAVNLDNAEVVAAGSVSYVGTALGGKITGNITAEPVNINVAQSLPPSVTELHAHDVFVDKGGDVSAPSESVWSAELDLTVDFPRRFNVFGRGLESEWEGKVEIGGTTDSPQVNGKIDLVRGTLDVAGSQFTLTEGNVTIRPEDNFDPSFVVVAEAQSGDVLGQIKVSGRVSDPQLEISSVPPLPEDEVLARTLFGKSASSLSGLEAVQLATALAGLTGNATGGSGILDRTRAALGVDVLRVDTDDDGNALVGAGSYVAEGVYVGVEQGTGADSSAVEVEIDVTDNITVTTEAGANASARAGVEWRWDY